MKRSVTIVFFAFTVLLGAQAWAGSGKGKKAEDKIEQKAPIKDFYQQKKKKIQILPVKINRKDKFLEGQLVKMAIRHIAQTGRYELSIGDVRPVTIKEVDFYNLDMRVQKGPTYRIELRIFELQRETLLRKVVESGVLPGKFLQKSEEMFRKLFMPDKSQKLD